MHAPRVALLLCCLIPALSCGDSNSGKPPSDTGSEETNSDATGGDVTDTQVGDLEVIDISFETSSDVAPEVADVPDVPPEPGEFGAPCEENKDCSSGWCVTSALGPVCSTTCIEECPGGWNCVGIAGETDVTFLCVPKGDRVCEPCTVDTQCGSGYCIEMEEGHRCSASCDDESDCNAGFSCEMTASEGTSGRSSLQCVPDHDSCDCLPGREGLQRPCNNQNDAGLCWGLETCLGADGWSTCDAPVPAAEVCDGVDNNCNLFTDENLVDDSACENTNSFGTCLGRRICQGEAGFVCVAPDAAAESCNFADDNCDGEIDDGFADPVTGLYATDENCGVCGNDCTGFFPNAVSGCASDGTSARCVVESCAAGYYQAGPSTCLPIVHAACLPCTQDANCVVPGNACVELDGGSACVEDCAAGNLNGRPANQCDSGFTCKSIPGSNRKGCFPNTNSCECLNNDDRGETRACTQTNTFGTCAGAQTCNPTGGGFSACSAKVPALEVCNGQDDDCDGVVDEDVVEPAQACSKANGNGTCGGDWTCTGAAGWSCNALTPAAETCNARDDDCDGTTDEGFKNAAGLYTNDDHCGLCGRSCDTVVLFASATECRVEGNTPVCVATSCDPGFYIPTDTNRVCVPSSGAKDCTPCADDAQCSELVGGKCTDIDGGRFCSASCGPGVNCAAGYSCDEGRCLPTSKSCTCLAGDDGALRACVNQTPEGTCTGTETCSPATGWSDCSAKEPVAETCNGQDDNCDGRIDESVVHEPPSCENTNANGTCKNDWFCDAAGGWVCPVEVPAAETCNFRDDNCDGKIDEGFKNGAGRYVGDLNCGNCGTSCVGLIPNATAQCVDDGVRGRCEVKTCAPGFYQAGPLTCLPITDSTCVPCATDSNCPTPGDKCLDLDGGKFCGRDCSATNVHGNAAGVCDAGFECTSIGAARQCVPVTGSCSCNGNNSGDQRTCKITNTAGTCYGAETCDSEDGWGGCTAKTPLAEVCNGLDDDCDGRVDEDVAEPAQACANTVGADTCSAPWICAGTDGWVCNAGVPKAEICNGTDDNCNGQADEPFKNGSGVYNTLNNCGACGASCAGFIPNSTEVCHVDGASARCEVGSCDVGFYQASATTCLRSTDSSCLPCATDANCPTPGDLCLELDGGKFCGRDCGASNRHGTPENECGEGYECLPIAALGNAKQCVPMSGSCSCLDDDRDDVRSCSRSNGLGTCGGTELCVPEDGWGGCTAKTPATEVCNGLDDDCDGRTDEDVVAPAQACANTVAGVGTCTAAWVCAGEAQWVCNAATPKVEVCNGQDDNCNGQADETFKNGSGVYNTLGNCGACGIACANTIPNSDEACVVNGAAARCEVDSCDLGFYEASALTCLPATDTTCVPCVTDANCPTPGDRCLNLDGGKFCGRDCAVGNKHGNPAGECEVGFSCDDITALGAGVRQCVPESGSCSCVGPDQGETRTCIQRNVNGTCFGSETCEIDSGWEGCSAKVPAAETCNGLDDDCDGFVDEGVVAPVEPCAVTVGPDTCTATWVCGGGAGWTCNAATPSAEVCDFADNNCKNGIDETFKVNGKYVNNQNCGSCGISCEDAIPNATAVCAIGPSGNPRCEVGACDSGYFKTGPLSCTPVTDRLCLPCEVDSDCGTPGDRCVDVGDGKVCGKDCSADNLHGTPPGVCYAGFACEVIAGGKNQCVPTSDTCSCLPANRGATRTCQSTSGGDTCFGLEVCDPNVGWKDCSADSPTGEVCNGLDDNCNGLVDEGVEHTPATCTNDVPGVGTCTGTYSCQGVNGWQCPVDVPEAESCNFQDDNCNDLIDEAFKDGQGRYTDLENCGSCGVSCVDAIPNSTEVCRAFGSTARCEVQTCDAGFYQVGVSTCLPASDNSCVPCLSDANCPTPGDRCLALDGGFFCGRDCAAGNKHGLPAGQCSVGYECQNRTELGAGVRQCVPESDSCTCLVADQNDVRTCQKQNGNGTCFGAETCDADTGWVGCSAKTPAVEVCNGVDDDCDGFVDEGVVQPAQACAVTNTNGTCSAAWACSGAQGWQCNARTPAPEVCDFADNNCNGQVDEGYKVGDLYTDDLNCGSCGISCNGAIPNALAICDVGPSGAPRCEVGVCDPDYYQSSDLSCTAVTENLCAPCTLDSDCRTPGDRCVTMNGAKFCGQDCSAGNEHDTPVGVCDAGFTCTAFAGGPNQCVPRSGTCSCLPDNSGATRTCQKQNGSGTCFGIESCDPNTGWIGCSAKTPAAEACDGGDNDCDGLVDENVVHAPTTCSTTNGNGTCSATYACGGAAGWQCPVATPIAEACNFTDDNCNGQIDEAFKDGQGRYVNLNNCGSCGVSCVNAIPNATEVCVASGASARCEVATCDAGFYKVGTSTCLPATDSTCAPCVTDSNCPTPGDRCLDLDGGKFCGRDCAAGNNHGTAAGTCSAGYTCDAFPALGATVRQCVPASDSCTCLTSDEGEARACKKENQFGTCFGSETCDADVAWVGCNAKTPAAEICNGQDDDCDGLTDEGVTPPAQACAITNVNGTCTAAWQCAAVSGVTDWRCNPATPVAETCDVADNDCDGLVDESFKTNGKYVDLNNCGSCGISCVGAIPNATAQCGIGPSGNPRCEVATCAPGYFQTGPLSCSPVTENLCLPCDDDGDCVTPGDRCITTDEGRVCGKDCGPGNAHNTPAGECYAGFTCTVIAGGPNQCVPTSGTCSCLPTNLGATRTCQATNGGNTCFGLEVCNPAEGWTNCSANNPTGEQCNGLDDNCNGQVDDGVTPPSPTCTNTNGFGTCTGTYSCQGVNGFQCPVATPKAETCNFADDNCNSQIDETFKNGSGLYVNDAHCGSCNVSCSGAIPNATATCRVPDGTSTPRCEVLTCQAGYYQAGPLTCLPATDNTCAPCSTDANCRTPGDRCLTIDGAQVCGRDCAAGNVYGTTTCGAGNTCRDFPALGAGVKQCVPTTNSCTCVAGDQGDTRACQTVNGQGTCIGTQTCNTASGWGSCNARTPAAETCNTIDDNCNFLTDDVLTRGNSCNITNGAGSCAGTLDCVAGGGTALQCVGRTPAAESCNYIDDNCNGTTDETFSTLNQSCSAGEGACRRFGFQVCTSNGQGTQCNAVAASATTEICDSIDNDCDTQTDEGYPTKGQACVVGQGVCQRTGVNQCTTNGSAVECSVQPGAGTTETCNNLDDDCNGAIDNGFPTKGAVCSVGIGQCRAFGNNICNGPGNGVSCNAVATTGVSETCDLLDNDCDGSTDEDFKNAGGTKYDKVTTCGNCFTNCTTIYAGRAQAFGVCDATPSTPVCTMGCNANYFDLNAVPGDGCEFGLDNTAIYVSVDHVNAVDDTNCGKGPVGTGAGNYPCKSIGYGLTRATAATRTKVIVADGLYSEQVTMRGGISVLGGYRADTWERHVASTSTTIRGPTVTSGHSKTIIADGLTAPATLEGFIIYGGSSFAVGGNSYTIWVRGTATNLASNLTISKNLLFGGIAGPGSDGPNGAAGGDGINGQQGERALQTGSISGCGNLAGNSSPCFGSGTTESTSFCGLRGTNSCGGDAHGGNGAGAVCPVNNNQQNGGAAGLAVADALPNDGLSPGTAGTGGAGGFSKRISQSSCVINVGGNPTGLGGGDGGDGNASAGAAGCSDTDGSVASSEWVGGTGADALAGYAGGGGGGGGAGGGLDNQRSDCSGGDALGGSGGGGGAGGCGGSGGIGGTPGGGVFVVFITNTTSLSATPVISGNVITRGTGGDGGNGGNGGKGGLGGNGGAGGIVYGDFAQFIGPGGRGGQGGDGGHGGGGGGGCGGVSYGFYLHNVTSTPNYKQAGVNTLVSSGDSGGGGRGGASFGNAGTAGGDGASTDANY